MEPPEITAVKVDYSRTLSDGSYGSERAGVTMWATVREGQDVDELLDELAGEAREHVEARLKRSRSEAVRSALETREEREARWEEERRRLRARDLRGDPPMAPLAEEERLEDAYQSARMDAEREAQRYAGEQDPRPEDLP